MHQRERIGHMVSTTASLTWNDLKNQRRILSPPGITCCKCYRITNVVNNVASPCMFVLFDASVNMHSLCAPIKGSALFAHTYKYLESYMLLC